MWLRTLMSMTSSASCNVTLRRALGSNFDRANPQKPQSALQILVMANWRYPGPPCLNTSPISLKTFFLGRTTEWDIPATAGAALRVGANAGPDVGEAAFMRLTTSYWGEPS